jgi:hypothetical protein
MSSAVVGAETPVERREDFPVESFQHLEVKLQLIRKLVMDLAAEIAAATETNPYSYRVERAHVDHALVTFLLDPGTPERLAARLLPPKERRGSS